MTLPDLAGLKSSARIREGPGVTPRTDLQQMRFYNDGRYWARTSDPQLVELVLSQLS